MERVSRLRARASYQLVATRFKVLLFQLVEGFKIFYLYAWKPSFLFTQLALFFTYLFQNPYRLCRKLSGGKWIYGETPATLCDKIAVEARILSTDVVFDLGCGRGTLLFWFATVLGCRAVGIEALKPFITKGEFINKVTCQKRVEFREKNLFEADLDEATVIYLYGTTLSDEALQKVVEMFLALKRGVKIVTVSFSLKEFSDDPKFVLRKEFEGAFPWGKATVFVQEIVSD